MPPTGCLLGMEKGSDIGMGTFGHTVEETRSPKIQVAKLGFCAAQKGSCVAQKGSSPEGPHFAPSGRFARQINPALVRNLASYIAGGQRAVKFEMVAHCTQDPYIGTDLSTLGFPKPESQQIDGMSISGIQRLIHLWIILRR